MPAAFSFLIVDYARSSLFCWRSFLSKPLLCLDTNTLSNFHLLTHPDRERQRPLASVITARTRDREVLTPLLLAAIVALAVLLRVLFLGKSLWLDEGIAIGNAWAGGLPLTVWSKWFADLWSRSEFNMVFYFAALRVWLRGGSSEAYIRLLSAIPAIATLPLLYGIGRRLFDQRIAVLATLLLAVHGAHVTYSQEARGYTMAVFFCALCTYYFIRGIEDGGWRFWALYALTAALGTYTHLFSLLVVASHWVSLSGMPRRSVPWTKLIASSVVLFAAVTPALYFAGSNHGHQVEWIPALRLSQVLNTLSELAGSPVALPAYLLLWGGVVMYCRRVWRNGSQPGRWHSVVLLSWALVPLAIALVVSVNKPMLVPRYFLISAPASVLLAAIGAYELRPRLRHVTLWAAVLLSMGFVVFRYTRPKENWREATAYVIAHAQNGDGVVVVPGWSEPVFAYYRDRLPKSAIVEIATSALSNRAAFIAAASSYRRIWVIAYTRDYAMREPDTRAVLEAVPDTRFSLLDRANFRMVQVRLFAPAPARAGE